MGTHKYFVSFQSNEGFPELFGKATERLNATKPQMIFEGIFMIPRLCSHSKEFSLVNCVETIYTISSHLYREKCGVSQSPRGWIKPG